MRVLTTTNIQSQIANLNLAEFRWHTSTTQSRSIYITYMHSKYRVTTSGNIQYFLHEKYSNAML